jgi:hypothetical protein
MVAFLPVPPASWASISKVLSLFIDPTSLIHRPDQPGHAFPLVPRDKAGQRVVWPKGKVPVQPGGSHQRLALCEMRKARAVLVVPKPD